MDPRAANPSGQWNLGAGNTKDMVGKIVTNTCMFDPLDESLSFCDTHVRLEPVDA